MSTRQRLEAERLRKIEAAAGEDQRAGRRGYLPVLGSVLLWIALGLASIAWGLHTTHPIYGPAALRAGALLGSAGVLATLLWAYHHRP